MRLAHSEDSKMNFKEIDIVLDSSVVDEFTDAVMDMGALSASIEDVNLDTENEEKIFGEPNMPKFQLWQSNLVRVLFDEDADPHAVIDKTLKLLEIDKVDFKEVLVPDRDWVRLNRDQFKPIEIGPEFWIVPHWCEVPENAKTIIKLDPGLAFGTGSHPTTWLCLKWINDNDVKDLTVLDYGCGSGILGIGAMLRGAKRCVGVDIDEQAVESSRYNAQDNGVQMEVHNGSSYSSDEEFDIVFANILANPLRMLETLLQKHVKKSGKIVLSGILSEQADELSKIYSAHFEPIEATHKDGWVRLVGVKK